MLYKGLKGAASIPTNDLVPPIRIPMAGTDIYIPGSCEFASVRKHVW